MALTKTHNRMIDGSAVNIKDFGAIGDGVADDTDAINAAIAAASAEGVPVYLPNGTYLHSSDITVHRQGFLGRGTFTGGTLLFGNTNECYSRHEELIADEIIIRGSFYSYWGPMHALGGNITINGTTSNRGMYWANFERLRCAQLILDASAYGINQNQFRNVRAGQGIRLTGGGAAVIDANVFEQVDTTGANLTGPDGQSGYHIVDENDDGSNTIKQLYTETSGGRSVYGDFDILGWRSTGTNIIPAGPAENYMMFVSDRADISTRNIGDYMPLGPNLAVGGLWDVVDVSQSAPVPPSFTHSGTGTPTLVADSNDPSGLGYRWTKTSNAAFGEIGFTIEQYNGGSIITAFWLYAPDGIDRVIVRRGTGGNNEFTGDNLAYAAGNDWYLYRVNSNASADGSGPLKISVMFNTGESVTRTIGLSCVYAANHRTALLPIAAPAYTRKGISLDGTVNATAALPVGAVIENKDPALASSDTALWIKTASTIAAIATVP